MNTLTVERQQLTWYNRITHLKDHKGKIKATLSTNINQPRYGTKTIILNCNKFALDWSLVEQPTKAKKNYDIKKKDKQNT